MTVLPKHLAAAAALFCLAGAVPLVRAEGLPANPSVRVTTVSGEVIGTQWPGLQTFRSIPYAQPPIGKLRFRRALPVKPWSTARSAIAAGPACYQVLDLDDPAEGGDRVMSEDCLMLNVGYGSMPFGIIEDGALFHTSPLQSLAADASLSKPLLIGTNAEEMRYWTALDANGIDRQPDGPWRERMRAVFGPEIGDPLSTYQTQSESTEEAIITLIGDAVFRMPSIRLAEINAARQPTYM